jgi:predicted nuclease of restriction endonuclease-like (RecB) superfamily
MNKIQRHFQKENSYRNFRRNMLGQYIDSKYYERNDLIDDENKTHNAFDIGFISALEKIKFEKELIIGSYESEKIDLETCFTMIDELINERIFIARGEYVNSKRAKKIDLIFKRSQERITDDI